VRGYCRRADGRASKARCCLNSARQWALVSVIEQPLRALPERHWLGAQLLCVALVAP